MKTLGNLPCPFGNVWVTSRPNVVPAKPAHRGGEDSLSPKALADSCVIETVFIEQL